MVAAANRTCVGGVRLGGVLAVLALFAFLPSRSNPDFTAMSGAGQSSSWEHKVAAALALLGLQPMSPIGPPGMAPAGGGAIGKRILVDFPVSRGWLDTTRHIHPPASPALKP